MNEDMKDMLAQEIKSQIRDMSEMKSGSEEKSKAIDELCKLYGLHIEETKVEGELDERQNQRFIDDNHFDDELAMRKSELDETVKDRWCRTIVAGCGVVIPMAFYAGLIMAGFKFEEKGVIGSPTFKGMFNKFNPFK